jgi:vanillate/3-O-methylgallate O-demethylase
MTLSPFSVPVANPYDPEHPIYSVGPIAKPWEFNGWMPESMSWKTGCYIHGGLSGPGQLLFRGPDAEKFLSTVFVNNFSRFKPGVAKHGIACDERGLIAGHGVLARYAQDEFRLFVSGGWTAYRHAQTNLDVEMIVENNYLFQVAGPNARTVLDRVCGEDLSDVGFLRFRKVMIAGMESEIMRIGMAGTLAYELHGPIGEGPAIYDAVYKAGHDLGIERLGWQTYLVNHVEAGFPQQIWTFLSSTYDDPERNRAANPAYRVGTTVISGSVDPADLRARFRTPHEVGWGRSVQFDHEFMGREALEAEHADPKRTIVTLEWNAEDMLDVYASLFQPGEIYKLLEFPTSPNVRGIVGHADHVTKDGKQVGIASGIAYSYYFRKLLSHCTIDIDQATIGNEVIVHWGEHGGRIKEVRARVERYPYLTEGRNQTA